MATVNIDITTNTQQASGQVDNLNDSLAQTGTEAKAAEVSLGKMGDSLEKQEARIKTIGGAINLLGGAVEVAVGSLALFGVPEENLQSFETAALGAIALADGSKRVFEGAKELKEGLDLYRKSAAAAEGTQAALNTTILLNPYVLAAAAVVALGAALYVLSQRNKVVITEENKRQGQLNKINKEIEIAERQQNAYNRSLKEEENRQENSIKLLKARGGTLGEIFSAESALLKTRLADARLVLAEEERQNAELEKAVKILEDTEKRTNGVTASTQAMRDALENNKNEVSAQVQVLDNLNTELLLVASNYETARRGIADKPIEIKIKEPKLKSNGKDVTVSEYMGLAFQPEAGVVMRQSQILSIPAEKASASYANAALEFQAFLIKSNNSLNDFFESSTASAISSSLSTISNLAQTLADSQSESSEEAFESSKKYKVAAVVTSAIQSAFEAFGAAQQFGPILGPILGAAQVAAIAIASKKAISDINSSSFNNPTSPSTTTPNVSTPSLGGGPSFQGGFLPNMAPAQTPPVRAYVVTGDVTNGQVAEAQLQTRRRFG